MSPPHDQAPRHDEASCEGEGHQMTDLVKRLRGFNTAYDSKRHILEAADRIDALETENASLATVWFTFMKCCEELEDEAEQKVTPDNPNAHDTGFWRGQKHATKVIRHSASKAIAAYDTPALVRATMKPVAKARATK